MTKLLIVTLALLSLAASPRLPFESVAPLTYEMGRACTAWSVAPGYFVTAAHCIDPDASFQVGGTPASAVAVDLHYDLALVQANLRLKPLVMSTQVNLGETYWSVGFYHGVRLVTSGTFSAKVSDGYREHFVLWGNFVPGMSGSPIVDQAGRVVSVAQAIDDPAGERQMFGYGIDPVDLKAFVARSLPTSVSRTGTTTP